MCAFKTVDEYFSSLPKESVTILSKVRNTIKKVSPKAEEAMIYGVPGFKLNGKTLIVYAIFTNHVGLYPSPKAIKEFKNELKEYETSKGAIKFPLNKPLPFSLITKITKWCEKNI
jgi:uncharacterized protein YdhG (YjbR/CyaY superfamily)